MSAPELSPVERVVVERFGMHEPETDFDRLSDAWARVGDALEEMVAPFITRVNRLCRAILGGGSGA